MADILEAISRIDSLCASVGVRAPSGADFGSTLARALGDPAAPEQSPPASTDGSLSASAAAAVPPSGTVTSGQATGIPSSLVVPATGPVTSPFGPRTNPVTGGSEFHEGIDLGAPYGAPIRAAAAGVVTVAGQMQGYGNIVIIQHPNGMETRYAHQSAMKVTKGQPVAAGEVIGAVGATGEATGPHLHFEVRLGGKPVDPAPFLGLA